MSEKSLEQWQRRIFLSAWITYFSFYLIRVNFSVAVPGIMQEFGLTKTALGGVMTALFSGYAIGQFVNGQIGNHINPRYFIAAGLSVSAIINIAFGLIPGGIVFLMVLMWGINGFVQSTGWAPTVRTISNWFGTEKRTRYSTLLGTSYIAGSAFSVLLAGFVVSHLGWRYVFIAPALISLGVAVQWFVFGRGSPEEVNSKLEQKVLEATNENHEEVGSSPKEVLKYTLSHKGVWIAAFALFGLNIVRYGFLDWAPTYFFETQAISVSKAAYQSTLFPFAGILGAVAAGIFSDKLLEHHSSTAGVMLTALFGSIIAFPTLMSLHWALGLTCLTLIGFLSFGPHVLIVSSIPMDLGTRNGSSAVTGFIDGFGYIGAAITGVVTGWIVDNFGWVNGIYFWAFGALIAALMAFLIWRRDCREEA
ncbi:MAG: MFS transporter [Candidatus Nanohalobium sp.]